MTFQVNQYLTMRDRGGNMKDYPITVRLYANGERLLSDGSGNYFFDGKDFKISFTADSDKEALIKVGEIAFRYHKTGSLEV